MSLTREGIAWCIARDLPEGAYVNLGVGMPVLVASHLDRNRDVFLHSENGILGVGPPPAAGEVDLDLISAGKGFCTLMPGASIFDQQVSFTMMRGGHLTHAVLGGIEVAENGDFANWRVPGEAVPGVGGAMDLAVGARNVYVAMTHVTHKGAPKLVHRCAAPLTARGCVKRVYTDLAVIDVTPSGFALRATAPGIDIEAVRAATGAPLALAPDYAPLDVPERATNGTVLRR